MSDYTTKDAVNLAMDGDAKGFQNAINDILIDKVKDAVELKRVNVAASFMSPDSEEEIDITGDTDGDQEV
jgi:hypothetical protein